jgi:hypothetical protein
MDFNSGRAYLEYLEEVSIFDFWDFTGCSLLGHRPKLRCATFINVYFRFNSKRSITQRIWWGSNRQVPINIFLKERFRPFRPFLKHFSRKDFQLESGPAVSLHETIARRVRKRQITLVRPMS